MAQRLQSTDDLIKGWHFEREIIILCARWYQRFKLSLRDLVEMMGECGLILVHTTIMRWVQRFVPESRSAGIALPARSGDRGASTRPT